MEYCKFNPDATYYLLSGNLYPSSSTISNIILEGILVPLIIKSVILLNNISERLDDLVSNSNLHQSLRRYAAAGDSSEERTF